MDCTNSQRGNRPNRPQMPQPPCMNTNCSCAYGTVQYSGIPSMTGRTPMQPRREEVSKASPALAMGYVPWQRWGQIYPMDKGFERGTIFPELDLPFVMGRCRG